MSIANYNGGYLRKFVFSSSSAKVNYKYGPPSNKNYKNGKHQNKNVNSLPTAKRKKLPYRSKISGHFLFKILRVCIQTHFHPRKENKNYRRGEKSRGTFYLKHRESDCQLTLTLQKRGLPKGQKLRDIFPLKF
jgi:hypothetical protein